MSGDEQRDTLALIAHQAFLVTAPMTVVELAGYDQQVYETVLTRTADAILSSAWLDRVSREVAAQALDEAAAALVVDRVEGSTYSAGLPLVTAEWASAHTERWLRARAASIRSGATS